MSMLGETVNDGWVVTKRNLLKIKRIPDLLIFSTIQPIMFVLLFAYVFGGPSHARHKYASLMPGIFCLRGVRPAYGDRLADDLP